MTLTIVSPKADIDWCLTYKFNYKGAIKIIRLDLGYLARPASSHDAINAQPHHSLVHIIRAQQHGAYCASAGVWIHNPQNKCVTIIKV